ncbi:pseudouridine synthase Rsu [Thermodesulfobium narugense DSM 14796]|uniref:Pseudouridine synthase Rsu n=1 Tax=Thermodesulfobium narugense DSM 14796 TaxID=747365 RepID=M1E780_9BACT|nr:pseudouridine synthase [Thermodesulfobium narugense]AEE13859.1 pseudouridine synthase Rsu [Thermodesulfobium narugense DSM 14796]
MRINKFLSFSGLTSRRKAEDLILSGKVEVNDKVISDLSYKVDPNKDVVKVNGRLVKIRKKRHYLLFYKPRWVLTALGKDPGGLKTLDEYIKDLKIRLFPAGRLDFDSEGLLLLTDDGDFAHKIHHPSFEVVKKYQVLVNPIFDIVDKEKVLSGCVLMGKYVKPDSFKILKDLSDASWLEIAFHEGMKHLVKEYLKKMGYSVKRLIRVAIGDFRLTGVPGSYRWLSEEEVSNFKKRYFGEMTGDNDGKY